MTTNTFNNLVVVELASVLAGPFVGRFFREHGARIIKIENPNSGGDVTRTWRNGNENSSGLSAYYVSVNQGKDVTFLDLKNQVDHIKLLELLTTADILLTNFRYGEDEKFQLKLNDLKERFPKLIIGQIDGFGADNPRAAYDIVLQAETGYLSMTGSENHPAKLPVAFIDILAGHQLKTGILMAMLNKQTTGLGCIVRVSLKDAAIATLMNQASNYLMSDLIPSAIGTLHPNIAPYGEYCVCSDGKSIVLAIGNNKQFEALLNILDLKELQNDIRFLENPDRVKNRAVLNILLNEAFGKMPMDFWMRKLILDGVPAGAIRSINEVLDDPSVAYLIEQSVLENNGQKISSVVTSAFRFE